METIGDIMLVSFLFLFYFSWVIDLASDLISALVIYRPPSQKISSILEICRTDRELTKPSRQRAEKVKRERRAQFSHKKWGNQGKEALFCQKSRKEEQ
jgi:hypothetical protein